MIGVDGILAGTRNRAGFFARNDDVPALVISVGRADRIGAALGTIRALPGGAVVTLERVHICKRDGESSRRRLRCRIGIPAGCPSGRS